jgi:hypothetical protein
MDVTKSVPEILLKIVLKCVENSVKILFLNLKFEFKYIYIYNMFAERWCFKALYMTIAKR